MKTTYLLTTTNFVSNSHFDSHTYKREELNQTNTLQTNSTGIIIYSISLIFLKTSPVPSTV